ncbi:ceramide glucosyltransferase [Dissulfurispira thermophila]|uniref:Ceramide glucosyltransferase n=2 Tax=root TaxID=1 RepID=A0A7G1GY31_9BACT|nr:ceramide glucosyltransferase [Dissulfurispira thermophila]BCB95310.1 ceramide glucosyltransferase [Dissulfurispira thermophila]
MEIFYVLVGLTVLGLIAYGLQIWAVRSTLKKGDKGLRGLEDKNKSISQLPTISILKPLKGLDDNLFDNLASFCTQDYPKYEIIFSLQDHNDPAYKVARKIKDKYPERDISIIVERCDDGLNPKVNNLIPAYKASKYQYILISDSNVMVDNNYLRGIVKHMDDPDVGLVSNVIKGIGGSSIGSIFENLHLNSFIIGSVCFLDRFLKMPCVIGKSMLMRKKDLEAIGGFRAVKDVLAEDYIIGKKIHKRGKKVVLSNHIIKNVNEYWNIKRFLNRHTRWGKLRWRLGGIKYFSELLGNPVFMSCLAILLWEVSRITISFALIVSFVKILGDYYLSTIMRRNEFEKIESSHSINSISPFYYLLSPIKDLVIGLVWFVPILSNTVVWRGNRYIIGKETLLKPCSEANAWRYRFVEAIKTKFA